MFNNAASSRPVQDATIAFILPQKPLKEKAEVSIFKADKYFNNTTTSYYATVPGGIKEEQNGMLTWDAIPNTQSNPPPMTPTICDDPASDASSDLFKIEDISSTAGYGYGARWTAGYTSGCSSLTHYAPSEASI
nr:protein PHYTOCHROME KINASE SUBSTRATE 3-like [Ipomoea batatas]